MNEFVAAAVFCYYRVDEFKQQLYFLHQNIASNSDKTQELHENTQQLTALFHKIDQMEVIKGSPHLGVGIYT